MWIYTLKFDFKTTYTLYVCLYITITFKKCYTQTEKKKRNPEVNACLREYK